MSLPAILYDSRFLDGTPAATDTATGYDVLNIIDYRTYTFWQAASFGTKYITVDCGSAKSADALAIISHNLYTATATVSVESSTDEIEWTPRLTGFVPGSDGAFLKTFTSVSARYWRIKIVTAAVAPRLAVAMLGEKFEFETIINSVFDPAPEKLNAESSKSKAGHLLGSTLQNITYDISMTWEHLTDSWVINTFKPAWDAHLSQLLPFFWAWDLGNYPTEVYYVKIPDGFELTVSYTGRYRKMTLTFEGVKE